ncbi:MAG: T9SS type A sorting domain-containing protein, partial [Chitinophagaceae bacterium]|nr:T9SS type A sorting domain-containing protein [Chitinophagaceae bacterium]
MKKRIKLPFAKFPFGGFRGLIALSAILLLQSSAASAQTWQWATAAGSKNINNKADRPVDLATDANGNSYLLSKVHSKEIYVGSSSIPDGQGLSTSVMTMLSSLDKNGNYRWSKIIGAAATDPKEIKIVKDKVYMMGIVGTSPGYKANYDKDYTTPSDYYSGQSLACYDTSGNFKWVVRPDSVIGIEPNIYLPISFDVDDVGNSYMLVTMPPGSKIMGSSMSIPSTAPFIGYGFYVLKYNPSGSLLSVTMLKDFCYAQGNQGGVDRYRFTLNKLTNQYYVYGVAGQSLDWDTLYIKSKIIESSLFFAAFDNDGTYKWDVGDDKNILGNISINGAKITATGDIIIGGSARKDLTFNGHKFDNPFSTSTTPGVPFIMKMSNTGSLIWCKSGGGTGSTQAVLTFAFAANDKYSAIGGLSGLRFFFGDTKDSITINTSTQDGWYAIVDNNSGKMLKTGSASGDGFYDATTVLNFSGNDFLIGGYFESSSLKLDGSSVSVGPAKSGTDLFVAKMSTNSLSIEDKTSNLVNIKIYPNPANDVVNIRGAAISSTVALYDMQGRMLKRELIKASDASINLQELAKGNYLLKITTQEGEEGSA